jgi:hypothetical protein
MYGCDTVARTITSGTGASYPSFSLSFTNAGTTQRTLYFNTLVNWSGGTPTVSGYYTAVRLA